MGVNFLCPLSPLFKLFKAGRNIFLFSCSFVVPYSFVVIVCLKKSCFLSFFYKAFPIATTKCTVTHNNLLVFFWEVNPNIQYLDKLLCPEEWGPSLWLFVIFLKINNFHRKFQWLLGYTNNVLQLLYYSTVVGFIWKQFLKPQYSGRHVYVIFIKKLLNSDSLIMLWKLLTGLYSFQCNCPGVKPFYLQISRD